VSAPEPPRRPVPAHLCAGCRPILPQPPNDRRSIGSKRELEKLVGHPIRLFAYPFGLWDDRAPLQLRRAGFTAAFQLADKVDRREPLFTIRRIIVPGWTGQPFLREMRRTF